MLSYCTNILSAILMATKISMSAPLSQTLSRQSELPKLPIPPLEDTCRRYLQSLVGLQDPNEHELTKKAVQAFLEGDGPRIHEKLKHWAAGKDRSVSHVDLVAVR